MDIKEHEIIRLKKQHPCGSYEWEVLYVGADIKIKCLGCQHRLMLPRKTVEKSIKR